MPPPSDGGSDGGLNANGMQKGQPIPVAMPPSLDPVNGGPSAPAAAGPASTVKAADPNDGTQFGASITIPTWLLVAGIAVFAALGSFALHRALPSKKSEAAT
jgi:hypothetical protein